MSDEAVTFITTSEGDSGHPIGVTITTTNNGRWCTEIKTFHKDRGESYHRLNHQQTQLLFQLLKNGASQ